MEHLGLINQKGKLLLFFIKKAIFNIIYVENMFIQKESLFNINANRQARFTKYLTYTIITYWNTLYLVPITNLKKEKD